MEHNLDDSLNLEGTIESMDFDNSGVVVSQDNLTLTPSEHAGDLSMDFEEQQILMDTASEEVIDFAGDQFSLTEYSVQDEQPPGSEVTIELSQSNVISPQETMLDLNLDLGNTKTTSDNVTTVSTVSKYISVKPVQLKSAKKVESTSVPKQVAIAPKLPRLVPTTKQKTMTTGKLSNVTFSGKKQYPTIAPKPVTLVMNKGSKKISVGGGQSSTKGNTVLAQIGKQLVLVPTDGPQKIKLVSAGSGATLQYIRNSSDQAQLIQTKSVSTTQTKPIVAKVVVQANQSNTESNQPAVLTKLLPTGNMGARYVMQQKTVPISIGSKVLLSSPTKQDAKKQQIITVKSPQKSTTTTQGSTKKVIISANSNQGVILKTTAPSKTGQVAKDAKIVQAGQRTELHQIHVPGKGVQYIRLVTSSVPATKTTTALKLSTKPFILTDAKGTVIQMSTDKVLSTQPPPLVITGNVQNTPKVSMKAERKLVRIAPLTSKNVTTTTQSTVRSSQSLLAPIATEASSVSIKQEVEIEVPAIVEEITEEIEDIKPTLQDFEAFEQSQDQTQSDEQYQGFEAQILDENTDSMDNSTSISIDHPLIIIPNFEQTLYNKLVYEEDVNTSVNTHEGKTMVEVEPEIVPYSPEKTPSVDNDVPSTDLNSRQRKACHCTKSQCLKLYCDCFANGEFCNQCNCHNCHNNLENEELRQKAIRACLERNPSAFKPKIGKAKIGGPETIRRHNKGCNCKRSGCLKNYCECYEAKIACTAMCKCVGCRNVQESVERRRDLLLQHTDKFRRPTISGQHKEACTLMTMEVIEAVCQCLVAAAADTGGDAHDAHDAPHDPPHDPLADVLDEFARCMHEIIGASHHDSVLLDSQT